MSGGPCHLDEAASKHRPLTISLRQLEKQNENLTEKITNTIMVNLATPGSYRMRRLELFSISRCIFISFSSVVLHLAGKDCINEYFMEKHTVIDMLQPH